MSAPLIAVPLEFEGDRPHVTLRIRRGDGSWRGAHFLVDTGGGGQIPVAPWLAQDLGIDFEKTSHPDGTVESAEPPEMTLGGAELNQKGLSLLRIDPWQGSADGQIGPHLLSRFDVVFDYPRRRLELFAPGTGPGRGTPLSAPSTDDARFPRIEVIVADRPYGFLLDTGSSFTMVSERTIHAWSEQHPDWETTIGAQGPAAMGLPGEAGFTMMWIPEILWGALRFEGVGVVGRPDGTFEEFMSQWMPAPIIGALANNVLSSLRVEIHYDVGTTYVSRPGS